MRTTTARRWAMIGAVSAGTLTITAPLRADKIDNKERRARIECASGNYSVGVRLLAELWVATEDPTWIYNQGRCYEQNGQNELAVNRFREYLRKAGKLPANDAEEINRKIQDLEKSVPAASEAAVPSAPALVPSPPQPPATKTPDRSAELVAKPAQPEAPEPYYKRWWFWTGAGAVVAGGVVTAVLLNHRA